MAATIIFFTPKGIGSIEAPGIGTVRIRETLSVPGVSEAVAQRGECAIVYNGDPGVVLAARGTDPDAAALTGTEATTAGVPVPPTMTSIPLVLNAGDKVSVKALS